MATTVALLGTGIMGTGMTHAMVRAGIDVRVWNRTPEGAEQLRGDGVTVCGEPAGAVDGCDVVVTMVRDADAVLDVMAPLAARVPPHAVWLQMSTIGIEGTERVEALAREHDLALLDAPVLGTKAPAENGKLVVMVSGDRAHEGVVQEVLEAVGSRTMWLSERIGDATALKLVVNSWVGSLNAAIGQSVALAQGLGLDPQLFLDAISGSGTDTPFAHHKGPHMIDGEFPASFTVDNVVKDVHLMRAAAERGQVDPALLDTLLRLYGAASERGHGDDDMAAVVVAYRE